MRRACVECECDISSSKRWGFANLCGDCDQPESTSRTLAVVIADGKTDYHIQLIRNPSKADAEFIRSVGRAWDPRTQLKSINKVSE